MNRYNALLRAINVGGHTVKMDRLRALFEELGFGSVQTFIASGNVIFESPSKDTEALEDQIEQRLKQELGYGVGVYIRTVDEIAAIAAHKPFMPDPVASGHAVYIVFLKTNPVAEVRRKLAELCTDIDDFQTLGREVYWLCKTRFSDSPAAPLLGKALGTSGTMRNATTVRKLASKYPTQE